MQEAGPKRKKIKSGVIYQQSEKLFQGIDIIIDNFTACVILKSDEFEDEFDFNHFENLNETINKNFFVYEKIFLILFPNFTESDSFTNTKSLRNLENFVNKNFKNLKNFLNFAQIEIVKMNRVNELIALIEANKKTQESLEFSTRLTDLDLPCLVQSVIKDSNVSFYIITFNLVHRCLSSN